jgi:subfamily B ATP-binding cassette protein MsbA
MRIPLFSDFFQFLQKFTRYIGRRFYLLLLLSLFAALAETFSITLLLPLLQATQVGEGLLDGKAAIVFDTINALGIPLEIYAILTLMGVIFLIKGIIKFGEGIYRAHLVARMTEKMRIALFRYYLGLDYQFYVSKNTGHFVNILTAQIREFVRSFEIFSKVSTKLVTTIVYLAVALYLNWFFSLMAILGGGFLLYFLKFVSRYTQKISLKNSREKSVINMFFIQALHSMKYLKATARFDQIEKDVKKSVKKLAGYRFRMLSGNAFIVSVREPIIIFLLIGIILLQVRVLGNPLTPIFAVLLIFYRGMNTMTEIQSNWQQLMNTTGGVEMTIEEFEAVKHKQENTGHKIFYNLQQGIAIRNMSFAFEQNPVLRNINLDIPINQTIAFVGESGAGKSTLMDIISLLLVPTKGEVRIDGISANDLDKTSWRRTIGFVPQDPIVFDDTVANNITLWSGVYDHDQDCRDKTESAARKANCHDFITKMRHGYNTRIGDRGVQLSGGQRQRLAIARELYKDPQILMLDEATSALDTESERYIQQSIHNLKGKITVLIIAHRLSTIKNADYIYVLDNGVIFEHGTYTELTANPSSKFKMMADMQNL